MRAFLALCACACAVYSASAGATELKSAFEGAVSRDAEVQALDARRGEQFARRDGTGALFPGGWSATVSGIADAATTQRGSEEYVGEAAVPIWLRGERGARFSAADAALWALDAQIGMRRLDVAKRVRDAYWMVVEAHERLDLVKRRRDLGRKLAENTRRQATAGQAAELDAIYAEAEVQDAEGAVFARQSEREQATIVFRGITGQEPPSGFKETAANGPGLPIHPRVAFRRTALAKAEAERNLVEVVNRDHLEVGLTTRVERGDRSEDYNTLFGARLKVPFAYEPLNAQRRASADAEIVAASAELATAERELQAEVDRARAQLDGAKKQLAAAEAREGKLSRAVSLLEASQRAGQASLNDLIRVRVQMFDAANARVLARVAVNRALSDFNQALGVEP